MEDIDVELLLRLQELLDYEIEFRLTGIPRGTQIHWGEKWITNLTKRIQ